MNWQSFTLTDGSIVLLYVPSRMTAEDLADFKEWLSLMLRGIERRVQK